MIKNILLTFDYELGLGSLSGSVEKNILEPTDALLLILKANQAKAIFFIDTTYLYRLNLQNNDTTNTDFKNITEQLKKIVNEGHYIFHHIHPHWLDAIYLEDINQWDLSNNSRFGFNQISIDEREMIMQFSHDILSSVYKSVGMDIKPEGFRAGGLFIEPFKNFIPYFNKHSIKYEFSVVPGQVKEGRDLFYNFSNVQKYPYSFSSDIAKEDKNGQYIQFPISVMKLYGVTKILNGLYYRLFKHNKLKQFGDGKAVSSKINSLSDKKNKHFSDYLEVSMPLSVEMLNPIIVKACVRNLRKENYIHFLSHPKLLSKQSLISLNVFLNKVNKKYKTEYDFKKIGGIK